VIGEWPESATLSMQARTLACAAKWAAAPAQLAVTLLTHWSSALKTFGAVHLHNGHVEAVNSLVQAAKARAWRLWHHRRCIPLEMGRALLAPVKKCPPVPVG
jgi:hypothetical protein